MKARWFLLPLITACGAATTPSPQIQPGLAPHTQQAPLEVPAGVEALEAAFSAVSERVSKSVVAVRVESKRKIPARSGFPFGDWFGPPDAPQREQIQRGTGSGVVIRADGYILTNRHVIENATHVQVVFQDGRSFAGTTLAVDGATDLAVVKVDATGLDVAPLADSSRVRPGQWVVAIGSPFGLDYTVTVGVVSAVGRGGMGMNEIEDYLQTDASINPGNSGGPLVNLHGEVVGINTMIVGSGTGIGFAIPSSLARSVADQLIDTGGVHRAFIGVGFQDLTPELAEQLGVQGRTGAVVNSVMPGGPADKAGMRAGDVIVSVDGQPIAQSRALLRLVLQKHVGSTLLLGVVRDKQELPLTLMTVERPSDARRPATRSTE